MLYLVVFFFGISIGIVIGGFIQWAKYHYPEAQAIIRVKTARAHAEAARLESEEMKYRRNEQEHYERMAHDH